jgi:hypothetical protein
MKCEFYNRCKVFSERDDNCMYDPIKCDLRRYKRILAEHDEKLVRYKRQETETLKTKHL